MESWWDLGEHSGQMGEDLALYQITCAFCLEKGKWKKVFNAEKKKPNGAKILHFDTFECGNCKGYVMVLWSNTEHGYGRGVHNYYVLPWPMKLTEHPKHWPEQIGRFWLQAKRSLKEENWDAAAVMARSALQAALRDNKAAGGTLKKEIDDLSKKGILPPIIKEWSDHVRELGNDSAHPEPGQAPTDPRDAKDIVRFLDFLLEYLYTLPHEIQQYRDRKVPSEGA